MTPRKEIVVTGMGVVSPIGIGKAPFWTSLAEGRGGIRRLDMPVDAELPPPIGGIVADFDPKQYVRPRKSLKVMSRDIQLAFAAADLACVDAGLRERPIEPERLGVLFGAGLIGCDLDEMIGVYRACIVDGKFDFQRWGKSAMGELFPLWMLKYLPNMPACHIGIGQDARGPNNSLTLGDVSSLSAMIEAVRVLQRGQADAMIVGGVGARIHPGIWSQSHVLGLSRRTDEPIATPRPFDADRDGLVNGEGAGSLILETRVNAAARGAPALARFLGHGVTFEPHANGQPLSGDAIRRAIVASLADAGLRPADLGCVIAHGLGTIDGDRLESQAIRATLGDLPVTAPKSLYGYLGAASGALETVVGVLSLQSGQIPPTLHYDRPDPQCPICVVHGGPRPLKKSAILVLAYSNDGQAAAVVLGAA
jgi:3-oxoacyl-[acyl-carrier-protein] synthase II